MKIIVIGTGYVGLVHAAVCSEYGHDVYAHDIDKEKIEAFSSGQAELIEKYVNEPGLVNIIRETLGKSLHFSYDLEAIIEGTDAIFMCLPTPPNIDGSTNLTFYDAAAEFIAEVVSKRKDKRRLVLVNKSTVPIGTARHLEDIMKTHGVESFWLKEPP
jgi:UDPglucose 6-dehydrogenase